MYLIIRNPLQLNLGPLGGRWLPVDKHCVRGRRLSDKSPVRVAFWANSPNYPAHLGLWDPKKCHEGSSHRAAAPRGGRTKASQASRQQHKTLSVQPGPQTPNRPKQAHPSSKPLQSMLSWSKHLSPKTLFHPSPQSPNLHGLQITHQALHLEYILMD